MLPLALAAAGLQMAGGIMNGIENAKALDAQAAEYGRQAKDAERIGQIEGQQIAKAGRSTLGEAVASMAASGIKTDTGTATEIQDYIRNNAAADTMNQVMTRANQAYSARIAAANAKRAARSAILGGILGGAGAAGSTILGAAR